MGPARLATTTRHLRRGLANGLFSRTMSQPAEGDIRAPNREAEGSGDARLVGGFHAPGPFEVAPERRMTFSHLERAFLQSNALSVKFCRFSLPCVGLSEVSSAATNFRGRLFSRMAVG
jgi:hypothetical protein